MNRLRVALATVVLVVCAGAGRVFAAPDQSPYRSVQPPPSASASERDRVGTDARAKDRTPPPRPIVPPAGQQENPALREECAWLGQRIVSLLFRDDPMTGADFTPFYSRFGCPDEHLRLAFACVVHSGIAENDVLADRIALCWADPAGAPAAQVPAQPPAAAAPSGAPSTAPATPGAAAPGVPAPPPGAPGTNGPGTNGPGTNGPGTNGPGTNGPGTGSPGTGAPAPGGPSNPAPAPAGKAMDPASR
jgi:hypothetical protein